PAHLDPVAEPGGEPVRPDLERHDPAAFSARLGRARPVRPEQMQEACHLPGRRPVGVGRAERPAVGEALADQLGESDRVVEAVGRLVTSSRTGILNTDAVTTGSSARTATSRWVPPPSSMRRAWKKPVAPACSNVRATAASTSLSCRATPVVVTMADETIAPRRSGGQARRAWRVVR